MMEEKTNDKLATFLKTGQLANLSVGLSLDSLIDLVGLPDNHSTKSQVLRACAATRAENERRLAPVAFVVNYESIDVYIHPVDEYVQFYIIAQGYYADRGLPKWAIDDGWDEVVETLLGLSEAGLRTVLESRSINGRKAVYPPTLNYLSIGIEDSNVWLFFAGDDGVDGLVKVTVSEYEVGSSKTIPW